MSEILDFYQEHADESVSTLPWFDALQAKALRDFKRDGFPSRHHEEWKYTSVDAFLQQKFTKAQQGTFSREINTGMPFDRQLLIANGQVVNAEQLSAGIPAGVVIQPLMQALHDHADKIKPYLDKLLRHEHGFHSLNMAALQTGVFIYLPANVCVDEPIVLAHWHDQPGQAIHARHLIIAEAGSQATVIESFQGADECSYFNNVVTEVHVAQQAKITHYKIQREGRAAFHIGHLAVQQAANSQFNSHSLSLGGRLVRSDITFRLQEAHAQCLMNGIYMTGDNQHIDHHTTVHHLVADCQSTQDYKGVLTGRSRAVFNGKVVVAKDAQHTLAKQQNKNLLLSPNAEIDTKPQLEIFADDVICSHGATVGQLDEDALFYLATRGIERQEASRYLVQAFAAENLRLVPHPLMANWMAELINQKLG